MTNSEQLDQLDRFTKSLPACLLQDILADQFGAIARAIRSDYSFIEMPNYEEEWNQQEQMIQSNLLHLAKQKEEIQKKTKELARLDRELEGSRKAIHSLIDSLDRAV